MPLIEKTFINHHIHVHDDEGAISVRLIDESCGPGEVVDETGIIQPLNGNYSIPLRSGGFTPASVEEVVYVLSKLKMSVRKFDERTGGDPVVIDHFFLPESDEQRLLMLSAGRDEMREVERSIEEDPQWTPPEWYSALVFRRANPGRSLFR